MSASTRLKLPMLASGQAQKEVTHNEALQYLDMIVAACVEEPPRADPPASPVEGACYIVAPPPTGTWAGQAGSLAGFTSGGWRFIKPVEGLRALVRTTGTFAIYRNGAWDLGTLVGTKVLIDGQQVIGSRSEAIDVPTGGATLDMECRAAVVNIINALQQHGLIGS